MTNGLNRAAQLQAALMSAQTVKVKIGVVTSYSPDKYQAKVKLQPEGLLTGWLPVSSQWVGSSWGLFLPPSEGQHVRVEFLDGHLDAGTITGMHFSNKFPPVPVPAGEMLMQHQSGSLLHFDNAGNVALTSAANLIANVGGDATVTAGTSATVKSPIIKLQNLGTNLLNLLNSAFATWAESHTHGGVQTGSGTSGTPTTTPGANTQTSIVQAE